jgi:hypothetical protein
MRHIALCLVLAAASPLASAGCLPILGTVKLTPEQPGTCTVGTFPGMQGQPFLGNNYDPQHPENSTPGCFTAVLKLGGLLPAYGYSGVTSEKMTNVLPPFFPQSGSEAFSPASVQGDRTVLTARSTFSLAGTRLYAAEVIIDSGDMVTEQSVITGTDGKGLFKNATGGFVILGNSIGETAQVRGEICTH